MTKSLDEVKTYVADKYLGQAGIHAFGVNHSENAIRVYVKGETDDERERVLKQLEAEAAPYKIITVESDSASIK